MSNHDDIPGLDRISRRAFFKLAGAGAAAAGLAACSSRPAREIVPYAVQPPELSPGIPLHYATALVEDGFAIGVVVASNEGRPTKLEGNPDHPSSLGATRASDQAAVLSLYDPQRARSMTERGAPATWSAIERMLTQATARGGTGLHLLLEPTSSPFVVELLGRLRAALPAAGVTFWSPFAARASLAGTRLAFGRPLQAQLDLGAADVIVTLDADLAGDHPGSLAHARRISERRQIVDGASPMSRIYAIEASYTPTGVIADHRMRVRASQIERVAAELLAELVPDLAGIAVAPERARWIGAIARDLRRAGARSIVVAGERQPAVVHAIAAVINQRLGAQGHTVTYTEPVVFEAGQPSHDLGALAQALGRGAVTTLLVLGGNPVYTAPADLALAAAFARVPNSLYLGLHANETARTCRYVVPGLHDLERWGAARAHDGTVSPIQPLIEPLFGGRSIDDVLLHLLGDPPATARDRTAAAWARLLPGTELEASLALGTVAGTAAPRVTAELAVAALGPAIAAAGARDVAPLELELRPHPFVHDGRHANNPWLLELPEPITKLTWDSAVQLSPATAARLGLEDGDVVLLAVLGRALEVPAVVVPGHADDALMLHAGLGRDGDEQIARGVGVNAFALWTSTMGYQAPVEVTVRPRNRELAITQQHWTIEHRPVVLSATRGTLELAGHRGPRPTIYQPFPRRGPQWAMSIDLTTCTGCSACVMACAAENNTPVVGRGQVLHKREMHWLRIDRYVEGTAIEPVIAVQPMTCQHCEHAPCEYVCPVEATAHSPDGLNEMAYNRCVGTRFCSNNCPYKVRRFNWFDYKQHGGLQVLGRNPDVTVRDRGVMEKCTYCVQRIRRVEIDARIAGRPIGPGEVRTACQQACPAQAISFGSIADPDSAVSEHRRRPHAYAVLHDQGTEPRTRYLARIRNPNEELA